MRHPFVAVLLAAAVVGCGKKADEGFWAPAEIPIQTPWTAEVSPANAHPEYPRPQMVREQWASLNGLWDYAVTAADAPQPKDWDGQILVPFCIESSLSGIPTLVRTRTESASRNIRKRIFQLRMKIRHSVTAERIVNHLHTVFYKRVPQLSQSNHVLQYGIVGVFLEKHIENIFTCRIKTRLTLGHTIRRNLIIFKQKLGQLLCRTYINLSTDKSVYFF